MRRTKEAGGSSSPIIVNVGELSGLSDFASRLLSPDEGRITADEAISILKRIVDAVITAIEPEVSRIASQEAIPHTYLSAVFTGDYSWLSALEMSGLVNQWLSGSQTINFQLIHRLDSLLVGSNKRGSVDMWSSTEGAQFDFQIWQ